MCRLIVQENPCCWERACGIDVQRHTLLRSMQFTPAIEIGCVVAHYRHFKEREVDVVSIKFTTFCSLDEELFDCLLIGIL